MNKIWLVVGLNTYSYDFTEMNTKVSETHEGAVKQFNDLALQYLRGEKERCANKYNVSNNLSFAEYKKIALDFGDVLDYGYESTGKNELTLSIRTHLTNKDGTCDSEEFILHMYPCDFEKGDFSQLVSLNDMVEVVDEFYNSIV